MNNSNLIIYTDGSCVNKIGGFGIVVLSQPIQTYSNKVPYNPCTNNIAELYAIYMAINIFNKMFASTYQNLIIRSDSQYSINSLTLWATKWSKNGWKNSKGKIIENHDLIHGIINLIGPGNIRFEHVKAHSTDQYNNQADTLANLGRQCL
jgi:ribonuclease HI